MFRAAPRAQQPDAETGRMSNMGPVSFGAAIVRIAFGAYCLSDAMSITNRYFTSLFSIRS